MAEMLPQSLQEKITERLGFYEDLGIKLFYRNRGGAEGHSTDFVASEPVVEYSAPPVLEEESILAKSIRKPEAVKAALTAISETPRKIVLPPPVVTTLFEAVEKVPGDTLLKIREDLGDCTRCKLSRTRNKIVFGDGNPKAEL